MTGRLIRVRGLVQGVGFRPCVWRLATELGLRGWVRNDGDGVTIALAGARVDEFLTCLPQQAPRLARIDAIEVTPAEVPEAGFAIVDSMPGPVRTAIGPDSAPCRDCLADLFDPGNRRWRYAFTTCTHCGPRFSVSRRIPYDRANTSLAGFALCQVCAAEYRTPGDRRFHAETTCCPVCGPTLRLLDGKGQPLRGDPIAQALALLRGGAVLAVKGLGGFHLAVDARQPDAVARLRQRKQREQKPLALMALNVASLAAVAEVGAAEAALLQSPQAPIVLCPKAGLELAGVAPGLAWIGAMLPATPIQFLLWHEAAGQPAGTDWLDQPSELLLVMSSANPHGEPLVRDNDEALQRLAGIADAVLLHDRDIVARCDDSVLRPGPTLIRRARGFTPQPIALAQDGPAVLALGGQWKNTVCVARGRQAFLSQHVGALDDVATLDFLEETVAHLLDILQLRPDCLAHDLHPDYASTRLAQQLAQRWGAPCRAVAHHHAHIAAVCAEQGLDMPVLGLAIDGVGLGPDGGLWGGELLRVDGALCQRLGHLRPLPLPGGDRAARQPWRMALAVLHSAAQPVAPWLQRCCPEHDAAPVLAMLTRQLQCPPTSSLGRLFDAAAALLGVCQVSQYEGHAAMLLESLAWRHGPVPPWPEGVQVTAQQFDALPLLLALAECRDPAYGAALFHATLAHGLARWMAQAAQREQLRQVVVAGGCAVNRVLMDGLQAALAGSGLTLWQARQAPPNDGGLALGQAWVARQPLGFAAQ